MKTKQLPKVILAAFAVTLALSACGKSSDGVDGSAVTIQPSLPGGGGGPTYTYTNTNTSTFTSTGTGGSGYAPYSYSINLAGNQVAQTPQIQTDNVLKVKFQVGSYQGNSYHQASELAVTIKLNGINSFQAKFTANNYTYGRVGEVSQVIDLSNYLQPGQKPVLTVESPMNDFYCTYAPNPFYYWDGTQYVPTNPLYNNYPGCRKAVPSTQNWSGTLIVQTSDTTAI